MKTISIILFSLAYLLAAKAQVISSAYSYNNIAKTASLTLENLTDSVFLICNVADAEVRESLTYFIVKYLDRNKDVLQAKEIKTTISIGGQGGIGACLFPGEKKTFKIKISPSHDIPNISFLQIGVHIGVEILSNPSKETSSKQRFFIKEILETYPWGSPNDGQKYDETTSY